MQLVNVKNLYLSELGAAEKFEVHENIQSFELTDDVEGERLAGKFKITRLDDSVIVQGDFIADVIVVCDRCLDNFTIQTEFSLEREFLFDRQAKDVDTLYVDKYLNIDLSEPIREELILALPMKKICNEECKGICSGCGENLNHKKCRCKAQKAE